MPRVHPGRYTAHVDGDFVVFIIGMRINKPWKVREWWPVFTAMPRMIKELDGRPELGFLGYRQCLASPVEPMVIQYWRSFEQLERFARDPQFAHLDAWRLFRRATGDSGNVGIWHETYMVADGAYETIYGNMPRTGLAAVGDHVELGSTSRAVERVRTTAGAQ
jgi:hypothetical protein